MLKVGERVRDGVGYRDTPRLKSTKRFKKKEKFVYITIFLFGLMIANVPESHECGPGHLWHHFQRHFNTYKFKLVCN